MVLSQRRSRFRVAIPRNFTAGRVPFNSRMTSTISAHVYEIPPRKDRRGVDLVSDVLPFGALWYGEPSAISNAVNYAKFYSRSHEAVIRVYDGCWQRDRNARARRRVQRVVSLTRLKQKAATR
jgi:hypothetical protein